MKKLLLLLFIAPLFFSCGDDDNTPISDAKLVGKWSRNPNSNSRIDTIEFTADFKFRESLHDSQTQTSTWSNYTPYRITGDGTIPESKNIVIENKTYYYLHLRGYDKKMLSTNIRNIREPYIGSYTKVE